MPKPNLRYYERRRVRRIFESAAAGESLEVIARRERMKPKTVVKILKKQAGVDVPDNQKGEISMADNSHYEQAKQRLDRLWEAHLEEKLNEAIVSGKIVELAKAEGVSFDEAFSRHLEELSEPERTDRENLRKLEDKRLAREYVKEYGYDPRPVIEADDKAAALVALETRSKLDEGSPVDGDDAALNRRVEEHARRRGCSYEVALSEILEGGD